MVTTILIGVVVVAFVLLGSFSTDFRGEKLQSNKGWLWILGLFVLIIATLVIALALGVNID